MRYCYCLLPGFDYGEGAREFLCLTLPWHSRHPASGASLKPPSQSLPRSLKPHDSSRIRPIDALDLFSSFFCKMASAKWPCNERRESPSCSVRGSRSHACTFLPPQTQRRGYKNFHCNITFLITCQPALLPRHAQAMRKKLSIVRFPCVAVLNVGVPNTRCVG